MATSRSQGMLVGTYIKVSSVIVAILGGAIGVGVWANEVDSTRNYIKRVEQTTEERHYKLATEVDALDNRVQIISINLARIDEKLEYMIADRAKLQVFIKEGFSDMKNLIKTR